jgi:hypothetical protein
MGAALIVALEQQEQRSKVAFPERMEIGQRRQLASSPVPGRRPVVMKGWNWLESSRLLPNRLITGVSLCFAGQVYVAHRAREICRTIARLRPVSIDGWVLSARVKTPKILLNLQESLSIYALPCGVGAALMMAMEQQEERRKRKNGITVYDMRWSLGVSDSGVSYIHDRFNACFRGCRSHPTDRYLVNRLKSRSLISQTGSICRFL